MKGGIFKYHLEYSVFVYDIVCLLNRVVCPRTNHRILESHLIWKKLVQAGQIRIIEVHNLQQSVS